MGKRAPNDNNVSAPSSIFTTLFGGISNENAVDLSIFSDNNPFKRKNLESQLAENEHILDPKNSDLLNTDISELKRRRKTRKGSLDLVDVEEEASKTPLVSQKSMKLISQNPKISEDEIKKEPSSLFDSKSYFHEQKQNPNLVVEGKKGSEKKKTKKRKRDEVEKEYEEKKYGATADGGKKVVVGEKRKKEDNETEDMLVQTKEEGFDDEGKLLRTIFVGNLPLKVKKKALIKEFCKFGEIDSVRLRSVPILDVSDL